MEFLGKMETFEQKIKKSKTDILVKNKNFRRTLKFK